MYIGLVYSDVVYLSVCVFITVWYSGHGGVATKDAERLNGP